MHFRGRQRWEDNKKGADRGAVSGAGVTEVLHNNLDKLRTTARGTGVATTLWGCIVHEWHVHAKFSLCSTCWSLAKKHVGLGANPGGGLEDAVK